MISAVTSSWPSALRTSTASDRLPLFIPAQNRLWPSGVSGQRWKSMPPPMLSKRMTSAPSWASVIPPSGAATNADPSITRRPSSAPTSDTLASRPRWSNRDDRSDERATVRPGDEFDASAAVLIATGRTGRSADSSRGRLGDHDVRRPSNRCRRSRHRWSGHHRRASGQEVGSLVPNTTVVSAGDVTVADPETTHGVPADARRSYGCLRALPGGRSRSVAPR